MLEPDISVVEPVVDVVPDVPIAMESETPEALESNIDSILGIKSPVQESKDDTPKPPEADEPLPEEPKDPETPEELPVEEPKPEDPKPAPEAPSEIDTSDLWVEVEDSEGNPVKLTLEFGVPDDFTFKNDKQLYEVMDAMREMRDLKEGRETDVAEQQTVAEQKAQAEQAKETQLKSWDDEIESLWDDGLLDRPKAQPNTVNWQKDPAVQKADSIFKFMTENNAKRVEDGKSPLLSVAHNLQLMNARDEKAQEADKIKADNAVAKEKAALIGKQSAPSSSEKVYKAGSARSIYDVDLT